MEQTLNLENYKKIARQAAAESCVLLKNEKEALPLKKGDKVAIFGRCALHYYKSGLGSGGLVNTRYVVSIPDALKECKDVTVSETLLQIYEDWSRENPIDEGCGWGTVPWSQQEMPVTKEVLQAASDADVAIIIIGRTAGEDQDNKNEEGSYLLTPTEYDMIQKVCSTFERTVVLLNVGNIIDMSWVQTCNPAAVMYVWQGGQEGGNGVLDVLTGKVNPCGKLTDTIAEDINDYKSTTNFGSETSNYYSEDIYVGYRYFETFAKEKVLYPFGFGLSYTQFDIHAQIKEVNADHILISANVENIGTTDGKEVIQVYVKSPQGKLGKPERVLIGFSKTGLLAPGETAQVFIDCPKSYFASYDDSGISGYKSCYILEEGQYDIYVGSDVRSAVCSGSFTQPFQVVEQLEEICSPIETFTRLKPIPSDDGHYEEGYEPVPLRTIEPTERIERLRQKAIPYTADKGYKLIDVLDGHIPMETFVAQLSDDDLICLSKGEGMCSPKVTPGTAAAFGGVTDSLKTFGIPIACCADGPSGIRMDCGTKAFSLPNGTALGSTFNIGLVKELFECMGEELRSNNIDTLLGPGINIHRNPLNGRNFEYISEDPLLTGKICVAQLHGIHKSQVTGTIKHFCANNQEHYRTSVNAVVSERALREIYLKGFELAVKEGNAKSIMTTYGPVNGIWTAGSFDLCTVVLRKEWGFHGIVMTDWWAMANWEGEDAQKENRAPVILAQNDLYMCCSDAVEELENDNVKAMLSANVITRYELQRNAENILHFLMHSPAMLQTLGRIPTVKKPVEPDAVYTSENIRYLDMDTETKQLLVTNQNIDLSREEILFGFNIPENGNYSLTLEASSNLSELAQLPISIYIDNIYRMTIAFQGTNGTSTLAQGALGELRGKTHFAKLIRQGKGLTIHSIRLSEEK